MTTAATQERSGRPVFGRRDPDQRGYFGEFGGRFVPETLVAPMEALTEVVESGKARAIGFSEWTPEQIEAGLEVEGAAKFVSSQPQYSMLCRAPEDEVARSDDEADAATVTDEA